MQSIFFGFQGKYIAFFLWDFITTFNQAFHFKFMFWNSRTWIRLFKFFKQHIYYGENIHWMWKKLTVTRLAPRKLAWKHSLVDILPQSKYKSSNVNSSLTSLFLLEHVYLSILFWDLSHTGCWECWVTTSSYIFWNQ